MFALILEGISEHLGSVVFTLYCDFLVQVSAPIHVFYVAVGSLPTTIVPPLKILWCSLDIRVRG